MKTLKRDNVFAHMKSGVVYRRGALLPFSNNLDRDLHTLVSQNKLKRPAPGLYYKPKASRFGLLPPSDEALVKAFLKKSFLMYSWNDYNKLGLGLTQLYNQVVVYNSERHEEIIFGNRTFAFKRPNNGFPAKLTREFLLVDLLNNAKYLTEDVSNLESKIQAKLAEFDHTLLLNLAMQYGKVHTRKLIATFLGK
ncbi:DUF6088 family protein [Legionella septentrionalis]|uniref:DUF6088 family protein n=1 Tax=Legionella septentrionalis TaxID=2498109 RepID=UPI000F8F5B88|nr:DUF6088 family protein [Legionella septentrionalis]RUR12568.1 hypothetical protein ELY10_11445 [Legionella septentrionalis]